jgi:hypothetical protein
MKHGLAVRDKAEGQIKVRGSDRITSPLGRAMAIVASAWLAMPTAGSEPPGDAMVVRLVHPDRQASRILALFEGTRAAHPAAALAAWKTATRDPGSLGKPLEAVIAFFNPEMAPEWRVLHNAKIHLNPDPTGGGVRWFAVVPRDDGTVGAAITAARLSDGADEPALVDRGVRHDVKRLGRPGAPVSVQVDETVIVASSRDELISALRQIPSARRPGEGVAVRAAAGTVPDERTGADPSEPVDSGLTFELDTAKLAAVKSGSLELRRGLELIRGLGCRRLAGNLALKEGRLGLEVSSSLDPDARHARFDGKAPPTIERAWLEAIPSSNVMGVVSLALDPNPAFWESAFALADRVERLDPARAAVAPLRARINLLAATAGARPEVDLWPHLRGVTASLMGDPNQPGRVAGILLILHADAEPSAERLASEFFPRLGKLLPDANGHGGEGQVPQAAVLDSKVATERPRRVAKVSGRSLTIWRRGRNVLIAWGHDDFIDSLQVSGRPEQSIAVHCPGWGQQGRGVPQRIGLIWPGRSLPLSQGFDAATPVRRALADGSPVVWSGWTTPASAYDSFEYPELKARLSRFLDQIPLHPPAAR